MGIFDKLKNAIFGAHSQAAPAPTGGPTQASQPPQASGQAAKPASTQPPPAAAPSGPVDIEAVLTQLAARKREKLNWQTSIVDLMKVVDLDPTLENRRTLAKELGYTGSTEDTATMNIWLHKEVIQQLVASGGKVPDSLRR